MEAGFNDMEVGGELFHVLGLDPVAIEKSPIQQEKLFTIAQFLEQHPDPIGLIHKLRRKNNTNMEDLDFFMNFIHLHDKKQNLNKEMESVERELAFFE